ncbi:unnamed protein product [Albugo candida]|uniref:Uncharacterized protein n=1 Tax=Albugo candida TaxID=65357 RepID=A0A024GAV2_9STRA|nr:unnamed protein product [Albugo candida]|eukprot:CCI43680.1 unnamed protein product [Albugo candida]
MAGIHAKLYFSVHKSACLLLHRKFHNDMEQSVTLKATKINPKSRWNIAHCSRKRLMLTDPTISLSARLALRKYAMIEVFTISNAHFNDVSTGSLLSTISSIYIK